MHVRLQSEHNLCINVHDVSSFTLNASTHSVCQFYQPLIHSLWHNWHKLSVPGLGYWLMSHLTGFTLCKLLSNHSLITICTSNFYLMLLKKPAPALTFPQLQCGPPDAGDLTPLPVKQE